MTPGTQVWVSAPFLRGLGTVERVKKTGSLIVRMRRDGKLHTVHPDTASPCTAIALGKLHELTRAPDYSPPEIKAAPKDPPIRSTKYLAWIRTLPCAWTGHAGPSEASHHPRPGAGAMASKTDDLRTIPLCTEAHREFHTRGTLGSMTRATFERWVEETINGLLCRYLRETGAV